MRRTLAVIVVVALAGCEEKRAPPPPAPTAVAKPTSCGWDDIRLGQHVLYRASTTSASGGGAKRVGGEIVQSGSGDGPAFELKVVARQGVRAWAQVDFRNAKLPEGLPPEFLLEIHLAPGQAATWDLPHDAVRPAQLTVDGQVFNCQDFVKSPPQAAHTCIQPAPTCLFWLDGLVRRWRFPDNDTREMLELASYSPGAVSTSDAPPKAEQGGHFAGAWDWRPDPFSAVRVRYFVEGGLLVRESTPFRLPRDGEHARGPDAFRVGTNLFVPSGPSTRETTSFRSWVLDLLDGTPVPATWIPARSQTALEFASFPG